MFLAMDMKNQYITIDKIKWWVRTDITDNRIAQPLCPIHNLRLRPIKDVYSKKYDFWKHSRTLRCEDCKKSHRIPRNYEAEQQYVIDRLDAKVFKSMKFINLDDEALPIAKEKISSKDNKYFVTSLLTKSKTGLRLVVYAGKKGEKKKTQIFVEPDIKRLAFDQKDLHPTEIFTKLEATFKDKTKSILKSAKKSK